MAINKRKILEAARKFAQKGAKEKALKEYAKLLKADPKDAKVRLAKLVKGNPGIGLAPWPSRQSP